jgi:hypothetical protein
MIPMNAASPHVGGSHKAHCTGEQLVANKSPDIGPPMVVANLLFGRQISLGRTLSKKKTTLPMFLNGMLLGSVLWMLASMAIKHRFL